MEILKNKRLLIISGFLLLLCLVVLAVSLQNKKEESSDGTDSVIKQVSESNVDTSNWETFTHSEYGVSFKYPSDWEISGNQVSSPILALNGSYGWMLQFDPDKNFKYVINLVDSSSTESTSVSPAGYSAHAVTRFISRSDLVESQGESITSIYDIAEDTWDGTVIYSQLDPDIVGFGPGSINDNISGNYFGIRYWYRTSNKFADMPEKGDPVMEEMIEIMDAITNSIVIE